MENTNTTSPNPGFSFRAEQPVQTMMPYLPPNIRDYIIERQKMLDFLYP